MAGFASEATAWGRSTCRPHHRMRHARLGARVRIQQHHHLLSNSTASPASTRTHGKADQASTGGTQAEAAPPKPRRERAKKPAATATAAAAAVEHPQAQPGALAAAAAADVRDADAGDFGAAAAVQSVADTLLGPAAAASVPPVPNTPAPVNAFAEALAALSTQCTKAGGTLLLLPSTDAQAGCLVLDLALAASPGFGPDRSTWPARSTIRVGKKSSSPLLALVLTTAVTKASSEAEAHPIAAMMEASGPTAVHTMLNAVCIARDKLHRLGLDCAVCLELVTAPWMKLPPPDAQPPTPPPSSTTVTPPPPLPPAIDQVLRLHVLQRRLDAPVVDVGEFVALQGRERGAADVASRALADVVTELMEQRAAVKLPAHGVGELALVLKALALAANMASKARKGSYLAFVSTPASEETAGRKGQGGSKTGGGRKRGAEGAGDAVGGAGTAGVFPLVLEVRRLFTPLRMSVMGPAEGRLSASSSAQGLHKTLATKLSSTGYWSCQVDSPDLIPWLLELVLKADTALRHRGTRLGIMPELFFAKPPGVGTAAREGAKVGRGGSAQQQQQQQLAMHFLEYDPLVDELLFAKPKRKELAVSSSASGSQQLDVLNKLVVLRNQRLATPETGLLTLRPFIDEQRMVKVAVELAQLTVPQGPAGAAGDAAAPEAQEAGAAACAEGPTQAAPSAGTEAADVRSSEQDDDAALAAELAQRFGLERPNAGAVPLKTLLVSKSSEPGMVARAVGWELTKQERRAGAPAGRGLGSPLLLLRMGVGEATVLGTTAVAMVQQRLEELGLRAVALPRLQVVEEAERRFTVLEWQVFGERIGDGHEALDAGAAAGEAAAEAAQGPAAPATAGFAAQQ